MHKDTEAALNTKEQTCNFGLKTLKLFSYLEGVSKLEKHSKSLLRHPGNDSNQNRTSILKEVVERHHPVHKIFHIRV